MKKQRWEESEKRREKKRRSKKRKSRRKEDPGARKGRKVAKHCVFPMICGSLKRRVRSHLARWEMKNCTPLWRKAHFQVKMYKHLSFGALLKVAMSNKCKRLWCEARLQVKKLIKGPDNPTRQLLPIMSTKCCSGDGGGRKDKGGGGGPRSKTKLCVTKLYVKDGVWQRKMVCVTKLCVKDGVFESCVWKRACDKVVCKT